MEDFLVYIAKSAAAAGAFYLLYLVLFQHQKQFVFNRIYLPVSLALSFIIPLITFTSVRYIEAVPLSSNSYAYLAEAANMQPENPKFELEWFHYLSGIYVLGMLGFLFYLILGHIKAFSIIRRSQLQQLFNVHVNITLRDVHPFSFFNKIVLSDKTLANPNLEMIVQHEAIHVREKHTFDILFAEILFLFQWFNPFAWLLKDAIKNNLEYKTDNQVTETIDPQQYQLAMVGLAHKEGIAPFLTALNGSQLKNRIIMMKKKNKNRYALLKQLLVLPLIAVLTMSLSNKEVEKVFIDPAKQIEIVVDGNTISKNDPALQSVDFSKGIDGREIMQALGIQDKVIANGFTDVSEPDIFFIQTSDYVVGTNPEFDQLIQPVPEVSREVSVKGQITDQYTGKPIEAATIQLKNSPEIEHADNNGNYQMDLVMSNPVVLVFTAENYKQNMVAYYGGDELNVVLTPEETTDNGKQVSGRITDENGNPIFGAAILVKGKTTGTIADSKGNYRLELPDGSETLVFTMYGFEMKEVPVDGKDIIDVKLAADKATKEGEVKISASEMSTPKNYKYKISGKVSDKAGNPIGGTAVLIKGKTVGTITDMNGNYELGCEEPIETLVFMMPDYQKLEKNVGDNATVDVQLSASNNAKGNGLEVTGYKNKNVNKIPQELLSIRSSEDKEPLYIVDGKPVQSIESVNPDNIVSISVLKDASATALYGTVGGKNGVVLITTKLGTKSDSVAQIKIRANDGLGDKDPMIIVDGEITNQDVNSIDTEDIAFISVLKDGSAVEKYGEDAKDGVIVITTKKYKVDSELDLRKFFARNMKYPYIAVENNQEGVAKVAVKTDSRGAVGEIFDKIPENATAVGEVVVVAYKSDSPEGTGLEHADKVFEKEVKRVISKLPLIDIPELKGENVVFTVKFVLQERD